MTDGFIRVAAVSPVSRVGDPRYNASEAVRLCRLCAEDGVRVAVFPELYLSAYTCADLFFHDTLLRACEEALAAFMEQTRGLELLCVIGLPVAVGGALYNCAAVVKGGRLLGLVPKTHTPRPDAFRERRIFAAPPKDTLSVTFASQPTSLGTQLLFCCRELSSLTLAVEMGTDLAAPCAPSVHHTAAGATLIACPAATPEGIGAAEARRMLLLAHTRRLAASCIYADAGMGESGTDAVFGAHRMIASHGRLLAEATPFTDEPILTAVIDTDRTVCERRRTVTHDPSAAQIYERIELSLAMTQTPLPALPRYPFVPEDKGELLTRCASILTMQARALAARIERSHARRAVLGISGGLDSTLALLVAVRAADLLGRDRSEVIAVTMPCFGTTRRTRGNAEALTEGLGATLRTVDIRDAVSQHFRDIGQPEDRFDVVYENAQARERTQVLMDIANAEGGLVVGTGDLSELALGFATYNGDHMSMYAVNAGVPKTLIRHVVAYAAEEAEHGGQPHVAAVLRDVLATPVSPELLPPKDGEIAQCTEGIVGPYELHDFFLYYTLRHSTPPNKLLRLATAAFRDTFDRDTVKAWLTVFLRRFATQQFKRSCLPDGPAIGSVGVSPRTALAMPSDADISSWFSV